MSLARVVAHSPRSDTVFLCRTAKTLQQYGNAHLLNSQLVASVIAAQNSAEALKSYDERAGAERRRGAERPRARILDARLDRTDEIDQRALVEIERGAIIAACDRMRDAKNLVLVEEKDPRRLGYDVSLLRDALDENSAPRKNQRIA